MLEEDAFSKFYKNYPQSNKLTSKNQKKYKLPLTADQDYFHSKKISFNSKFIMSATKI